MPCDAGNSRKVAEISSNEGPSLYRWGIRWHKAIFEAFAEKERKRWKSHTGGKVVYPMSEVSFISASE